MIKPFPVLSLKPSSGPSARFRAWVRGFGVFHLSRSLGVRPGSVSRYLSGARLPDIAQARVILALSQLYPEHGGPLDYSDIFGVVEIRAVEMREQRKVHAWE